MPGPFDAVLDEEEARLAEENRGATSHFDAVLDDEVAQRASVVGASLRRAVTVKPDDEARRQTLAQQTGIPRDVVERNEPSVAQQARVQQLQYLASQSPVLAHQLADQNFAALAHDDAEALSAVERVTRTYLGASLKSGLEGLIGVTARLVDTLNPFTTSEQELAVLYKDDPAKLREMRDESPALFLSRVARAGQQASEVTMEGISPEAKAAYGDLRYFTADPAKAAYLSPVRMLGDALQSAPTTLALAVSAYVTRGAATRVEAEALKAGATQEVARQMAVKAAAETMAKLGAATEGAAGFGQQANQAREAADRVPQATVESSPEYQRLLGEGFSPEAARTWLSAVTAHEAGVEAGVADVVTNYLGGRVLGRAIGEGGRLLPRAARGAAGEAATEAVQSGLEQVGQNEAFRHYLDASQPVLDGVAESIAQGFFVGGFMGGAFAAHARRTQQAQQAAASAQALQALNAAAASSKLRERAPGAFGDFVQKSAGPDAAVYVDARQFVGALQQSGLDAAQIAAAMPSLREQLPGAIASQGDLQIPMGEYAARIAGTDLAAALLPHVRTSADGMSQAEAEAFFQDAKTADALRSEVERFAQDARKLDAAAQRAGSVVHQSIMEQLQTTGRFIPAVNELYSQLFASFYDAMGQRLGQSAEELLQRYPVHVVADLGFTGPGILAQAMPHPDVVALADQLHGFAQHTGSTPEAIAADFSANPPPAGTPQAAFFQAFQPVAERVLELARNPAALERAKTTLQQGAENARGAFDPKSSTIALLKNADLSTFIHEAGHFYLEVLTDLAVQPGTPAQIRDDAYAVMRWLGVADLAAWRAMSLDEKRPYHEKFARGFEAYTFEGNAPSLELGSVFQRFRAWLLNVYRTLAGLGVELNDEVRAVFGRMLATDEQIAAAEASRAYRPLFESAEAAGMSEEQWLEYQRMGMEATADARATLERKSLREMRWLANAKSGKLRELQAQAREKRKAVEADVAAEVDAMPVYQARKWLQTGELPTGEKTVGAKLDIDALKEMQGDGPAAPWRYLATGEQGVVGKEGLHPDTVAEMFGFSSGDELVRALLAAGPRDAAIEGRADQRMLEQHGELVDPAALERAAEAAIHNEARARFVAAELDALTKAGKPARVMARAAKQFAEASIAQREIRRIRPAQFASAEGRAARDAQKAVAEGKLTEAAAHKRAQLVNHQLAAAALDAVAEVDKAVAYLRKFNTEGGRKALDPDYLDQIDQLLERHDLRLSVSDRELRKRASLREWVEAQHELGLEPVVDLGLLNVAERRHFREMRLEEFRGLVDAVKNIEHLGRLKKKLLTAKDERDFAERVDEAAKAIEGNAKRTLPVELERNTWTAKVKAGAAEFFAMHRKFASLMREMDGFKDGGALWELFVRPMNEAGNREAVMREKATIKLSELFAPILKAGKLREKLYIPAIGTSLSREGRIMVALNTGNAGNLQRLLDGERWSPMQLAAVTDTLTKEDWDFVQGVWDYLDTFRAQIGAQQKRLTGIEPEWVEPTPVATRFGTYRGGYLPAKYDSARSTRSLADEASQNIMDMWRAKRGRPQARDSFVKGRADKVTNRPLRKDFGVITQHITEVTHRLAWQEYLTDASRLLRAPAIDGAVRDHYGPEVVKALRDTIQDVAAGEVGAQNAFEAALNYVRTGATIAGLGWRLTTALLQPIGLTQSMVRIGPKYVARGLAQWLGDAAKMENTAARIYEKSEMMRLRGKTLQREISEIRNRVAGESSALEASYFYLIQKMQLVADIPTWLGQYEKSVEHGADEATAIAQADQAVLDAQGGGQIKDLAAIQRGGPLQKLFTNFYSFFSTTYQLTAESVGRTSFKSPKSVALLAVDMLLLYSVPAALGTLLKAALKGEDDDKLLRQLAADQITYLFGTMVGVRELAGAAQGALGLHADYQGPASVRVFSELARVGKQVSQGEVDAALLKALNSAGGILFHYPAGQINATLEGLYALATGRTSNPGALIVGPVKN